MQFLLVNISPPSRYSVVVVRINPGSDFHLRIAALHGERGIAQQALADRIACRDLQLKRCEVGSIRSLLEGMILKHEAGRWQPV